MKKFFGSVYTNAILAIVTVLLVSLENTFTVSFGSAAYALFAGLCGSFLGEAIKATFLQEYASWKNLFIGGVIGAIIGYVLILI